MELDKKDNLPVKMAWSIAGRADDGRDQGFHDLVVVEMLRYGERVEVMEGIYVALEISP